MEEPLKVLIFSATFGLGHVRAANAIIEELRAKKPNAKITHLDFGEFLSKTFNIVVKNTYIELIKHTPKLWGKLYYRTAKIPSGSVFQRFLNGLGRHEFLNFIQTLKPDVVICTYPTVAGVLAQQRLKGVLDMPLVTVVTDYAVHSQWIHAGAGRMAKTEGELESIIFDLLEHPENLERMRASAAKAVPGRAAEKAVEGILQLLEEPKYTMHKIG